MLILSRRVGESVLIGSDISITVLRVKGDQVRLGVQAPKDVAVLRDDSSEKAKSELAAMPAETGNRSGDNEGPAA